MTTKNLALFEDFTPQGPKPARKKRNPKPLTPSSREPSLPKTNLHFHPKRALEVAATLEQTFKEKKALFGDPTITTVPELDAIAGIESPHDQACLLLCAIGSDRGVQSRIHYPLFRAAYDIDPRFVRPKSLARYSLVRAKEHFRTYFRIGMNQVAQELHATLRIVYKRFDGDPRNIFADISSVHEAVRRISERDSDLKLPGFGGQMARLLLKNYTKLGLVNFHDAAEATPKIDIHAIRIAVGTGIVTVDEPGRYLAENITDVLNEGYQQLCESGQLDGRQFNDLIWTVGNALCNRKSTYICLHHCPLYETLCTKLPQMNYRVKGDSNDGLLDTRVDDRRVRGSALFDLSDLTQR